MEAKIGTDGVLFWDGKASIALLVGRLGACIRAIHKMDMAINSVIPQIAIKNLGNGDKRFPISEPMIADKVNTEC